MPPHPAPRCTVATCPAGVASDLHHSLSLRSDHHRQPFRSTGSAATQRQHWLNSTSLFDHSPGATVAPSRHTGYQSSNTSVYTHVDGNKHSSMCAALRSAEQTDLGPMTHASRPEGRGYNLGISNCCPRTAQLAIASRPRHSRTAPLHLRIHVHHALTSRLDSSLTTSPLIAGSARCRSSGLLALCTM